jgi:glycosyltransferase involved in cell wall biosynthesis
MTATPRVSVVVSTFDRYDRLQEALASVVRQSYRNLEIIVVNDGSTDPRYASHPGPAGVIWIDLLRNTRETHGFPCLGHVRNVGIARAAGEYLAFLDDDDVWLPEKIRRQVAAIHGTSERMCCTEVYAGDGAPRADLEYPRYYRDWLGLELPRRLGPEHVGQKNYITHSSVLLQRSLYDEVGPYPEIPLHGWHVDGRHEVEDWELWRRCLARTRCRYLEEPLAYYDCKFHRVNAPRNRTRIALQQMSRALFGRPARIRAWR